MKLVKTLDGSYTVYSEFAKENYHSVSGALDEAFQKHVNAVGVEDGFCILDFCFGLGYNSIASTMGNHNLEIIGLESDLEVLQVMQTLPVPEVINSEYSFFRKIAERLKISDENNNTIKLIIGDALQNIDDLPEDYFHRVFFDPFSPQKQPQMWSAEIFQKVYDKMRRGGKLSTYSCAKWIRQNMKIAGFTVLNGPVVGRKSPATIGLKP
ncbi:MAG: hypothetical protein K9N07_00195 [Candidatus Cloacimonetes bacterium]|nr:hypothetical protein [Candidatus Cloacimonadota bacterium]